VAHYSRVTKIVIDVPPGDVEREVGFWQAAIGETLEQSPHHDEYYGVHLPGTEVHGQSFGLLVQRLGGGVPRVHLDIHTDDLEAEVARLERLGAKRVEQVHVWWVMLDPAGLPFCVIPQGRGTLDDTNARRWD
jgi:predicted enzyme related to lactoylglutathione lyase